MVAKQKIYKIVIEAEGERSYRELIAKLDRLKWLQDFTAASRSTPIKGKKKAPKKKRGRKSRR